MRLSRNKTMKSLCDKIASLRKQEPAGTTKWETTLRSGKIFGTTSVERSIQNP